MSRPLRIEFPGAYYHVMNRGLARQNIFSDRTDHEVFLDLLSDCHEMWGLRVIAYCLLKNHYHLLIHTPKANLSRVMRHLDGLYTQRYNRRHKRGGPLFRGRYKAIVVDGEEYLMAVARYIHHNPVAAGLVRSPERYAWSSCRLYVKERRRPAWLDADQLLARFPSKNRREAFLAFMRSKIEEPLERYYRAQRRMAVLGSERFIERVRGWLKKKPGDLKEMPEAKNYVLPDSESCLKAVGRVYEMNREELLRSRRGRRNEARAMGIYICRRMAGMKHEEIAKVFGVGGYSAVSSVIGRTQSALVKDSQVARRFEQIRNLLQR